MLGGERVLAEAVEAYRVAFGDRLLAVYALGSLAHGGFSELVSDIDVGLIISDPPLPEDVSMIQRVADAEKSKGPALPEALPVWPRTRTVVRGARGPCSSLRLRPAGSSKRPRVMAGR